MILPGITVPSTRERAVGVALGRSPSRQSTCTIVIGSLPSFLANVARPSVEMLRILLDSLKLDVDGLQFAARHGGDRGRAPSGVSNSNGLLVKLPTHTRPLWSVTCTEEAK